MSAAACHIASTSLKWTDKFEDREVVSITRLIGGFTGDMHNVSSPYLAGSTTIPNAGFTINEAVDIGTKCVVVDPATGISAVFIYGKYAKAGSVTLAAGHIVRTAYATSNAGYNDCYFTNSPDYDMFGDGLGCSALALSAMTEGNNGWFMIGGKAPITTATAKDWGLTEFVAATVKGLIDVATVTGASGFIVTDASATDLFALAPLNADATDGEETDALAYTVFTNDA